MSWRLQSARARPKNSTSPVSTRCAAFRTAFGAEPIDPRRCIDLRRRPGRRGGCAEPRADVASSTGRAEGAGSATDRRSAAAGGAAAADRYGSVRCLPGGRPRAVLRQLRGLGERRSGGSRFYTRSRRPWLASRSRTIQRIGEGWRAQLATVRGQVDVAAGFAIDAGGRAAPLARRLGAQRRATDRLVCGWVHGWARRIGRGAGLTTVEAVENGWFYTAPLPEERRVLAFLTDADLPAAAIARNSARLVESVTATREIRAVLAESKFIPIDGGLTAAHSSVLELCVAEG